MPSACNPHSPSSSSPSSASERLHDNVVLLEELEGLVHVLGPVLLREAHDESAQLLRIATVTTQEGRVLDGQRVPLRPLGDGSELLALLSGACSGRVPRARKRLEPSASRVRLSAAFLEFWEPAF